MVGNFVMHIAGPQRNVNQTRDGLVCLEVPMISRGHWFSRMGSVQRPSGDDTQRHISEVERGHMGMMHIDTSVLWREAIWG